jgi:hypothetical protein
VFDLETPDWIYDLCSVLRLFSGKSGYVCYPEFVDPDDFLLCWHIVWQGIEDKRGVFLYLEFVCDPDHFYCAGGLLR